jgi:hypothetical protein
MSKNGERRFDVSGLQVMASVLATVTGAVAASYLGVAGTIIGAAVMSVASTAGSAFYKHYLGRTATRLKEATPVAVVQRRAERMTAGARTRADQTRADQTSADQTRADQTSADQIPVDQTQVDQTQVDQTAAATEPGDRGPATSTGTTGTGTGTGGSGRGPGWVAWLRARPAWLAVALISLGVFVGVVGGITVIEAAAGKPLQTVVWNHKGSGTTVGGLIGGQSPHHDTRAARRAAPTHSASPTPAPSRTPSGSASPSPTPSTSSPSPTNSASPSPTASSPSPTAGTTQNTR